MKVIFLILLLPTLAFASFDTEAIPPKPLMVHHEYAPADRDLFSMLSRYAGQNNSISLISKGFDRVDLKIFMDRLTPGGFLFIELNGQAMKLLRKRNFERTCFIWKSYAVYRKPINGTRRSS